jgi:hypothetical protein
MPPPAWGAKPSPSHRMPGRARSLHEVRMKKSPLEPQNRGECCLMAWGRALR